MPPLISVIVPVYNAEDTLARCVDSILKQSMTDYEVILVNDGSSDQSLAICEGYKSRDARIKVTDQANGGASSARNRGIEEAQGKWIFFMDSDDWIEKSYLENFVIQSDGKDIVIQGYQYDGIRQGVVCYKDFVTESPEQTIRHLFETKDSLVGVIWNKLYKREVIMKWHLRFNTDIHFAEDAIFFFDYLAHVEKIQMLSSIGYHYVFSNQGLTSKRYSTEYYLRILSIFIEKFDYIKVSKKFRDKYIWNSLEYWLLYPNMHFAYQEFEFEDMYRQLSLFISKYHLEQVPKMSFTSVCLSWALRCSNPKTKYKMIRFVHLYIRRSENRICGFLNKDFKRI